MQRYSESRGRPLLLRDTDALILALEISEIAPIYPDVAERLVKTAARAGFHGRFPELPERLLSRQMSGAEVIEFISAYVNNHAVRSVEVERKFRWWAIMYLSPEDAKAQCERLDRFIEEWENHID
jgi:hypothetical protein